MCSFCNAQSFRICPTPKHREYVSERSCWSSALSCTAWNLTCLSCWCFT
jgi:hypothetical protein